MAYTERGTPIFPGMAAPLSLRDIFLRIPEQALSLIEYYQALMRGPSPLSAGERELIYAYGSKAAGCRFCYTSHSLCAIELGIRSDAFELPSEQLGQAATRAANGPLLRYAVALAVHGSGSTLAPASTPGGPDRDGWIDAVLVSGLTAYINRLIEGLGAYSSDEQHARNGLSLAHHGYAKVYEDVKQSLLAAGIATQRSSLLPSLRDLPPEGENALPRRTVEPASRRSLFAWLDCYRQLVFEGPSRVPTRLRRVIRNIGREPSPAAADAAPLTEPACRSAFAFAYRLVRAPIASTAADIEQLLAHGWTERDVIDLVITAAATALYIRVDTGLAECQLAGG